MTSPLSQEDLFGNPAGAADTTPQEQGPQVAVNDMDLTQTVLADIVSDKTAPLHIDDHGQLRRCTNRATEPVPDDVAAVVEQLLDSHFLTTRQRSCPGHGVEITATRSGRSALCRWRAYRRPSAWGPPPDVPAVTGREG